MVSSGREVARGGSKPSGGSVNEVAAPGRQHPDDRISVVLDKGCGRPPRGVKGKGRFPFQQRHGPVLGDFVGDRGSRHPAANDDYIDGEFGLGGVAHVTSISEIGRAHV